MEATADVNTREQEGHVFLVRHGHTELNGAGVLRGHLDPALDAVGESEAYALAVALAYSRPARLVSSPLRRATQTAEALGFRTRLQVEIEPRLIDRDYGRWAGRRMDELIAEHGALEAAPGVESAESVIARARGVLDDQVPWLAAGPVVMVAHDAVNRLLLAQLDPRLGPAESIGQDTGCWNLVVRRRERWSVEKVNQPADAANED